MVSWRRRGGRRIVYRRCQGGRHVISRQRQGGRRIVCQELPDEGVIRSVVVSSGSRGSIRGIAQDTRACIVVVVESYQMRKLLDLL